MKYHYYIIQNILNMIHKKDINKGIIIGLILGIALFTAGCWADKNPYGIARVEELTTGEDLTKWSDLGIEIAESLFQDFTVCSVKIDGEWKKGLYNEENELLVTQDGTGETYTVYHGDESITVPMGRKLPDENYVGVRLADVNKDGRDELYISGMIGNGLVRNHVIGLDPFSLMTDIYDTDSMDKILPEYRILSASAGEGTAAAVQAEFTLESGEKYTLDMLIEDADMSRLEEYTLTPVVCSTVVHNEGEEWRLSLDIRFSVSQKASSSGRVYVFMNIGLEYDGDTGRFIPGKDVELEYRAMDPASWG